MLSGATYVEFDVRTSADGVPVVIHVGSAPMPHREAGPDTLRRHFHLGGLFREGEIRLVYSHYDRMIVGAASRELRDSAAGRQERAA